MVELSEKSLVWMVFTKNYMLRWLPLRLSLLVTRTTSQEFGTGLSNITNQLIGPYWELATILSCRQHVCETSASMSTPMQPWNLTSPELCFHALPFQARSVVSVGWCSNRFYSRWSFLWYWHALTTAMRCWLDSLALSSRGYSRWWMLEHNLYVRHGSSSTACCCSATSIGYRCLSRLSSIFPLWSSIVYMVQLHSTWHASCAVWQTLTHNGDYILHRRQHSMFHQIIVSQSATMPAALLALVCGTACHLMLLHRRHSPISNSDWKRCCFSIHYCYHC